MCYSAQIWADYRQYVKLYGAHLSIQEFFELFWRRNAGWNIKVPKAMEASFAEPEDELGQQIKSLIDQFTAEQETKLQQELFKQKTRLVEAERALQVKTTKKAENDKRISASKIDWALGKLVDLRRTELRDSDSRIYPQHHAPVMMMEEGRRVIKPMRYQCRPAGKPAFYDTKYPGTYNARRDNLQAFWKELFGYSHGIMVANAFFENVNRHRAEGRELREGEEVENVVLEFRPKPTQNMLVACLWSRWTAPGEPDLLSFAAITDEPPPEVAAAGHDRCIIPIRPENIDAWLNPDPANLAAQFAIFDDRERPYFEHRMAA